MNSPEPRFARIASMIGDPTRARMLSALMGGQYLAAGELAAAAGVTAATASAHLTKLIDSELVLLRTQGRHRYFRLAGAEIAHALEALSLVAEGSASQSRWSQGAYKPLKHARTCYSHLAGELGVALFEGLVRRGTIESCEGHFRLTAGGRAELAAMGLSVPELCLSLPGLVGAPRPLGRQPGRGAARTEPGARLAAARRRLARIDIVAARRDGTGTVDRRVTPKVKSLPSK
jgi:DNA-binding transcriptional ArsR family regulator